MFSFLKHKPKSAFMRYFSLILILVFILLSLFSLYILHMSYQNFSAQQRLSEQSVLNQVIERIDNSLYFINQIAATTSTNSDIIVSGIAPSKENRQRNFMILTTLKNLVEENSYLDKIYLYEHTKGFLYTSNSDITTLEGSPESSPVAYCLGKNGAPTLERESNRYCSRLVQDGQDLYLVYDFVYSAKGPLNTLILKLNKEALFKQFLDTSSLEDYHMSIYGIKNNALFTTLSADEPVLTSADVAFTSSSSYTGWTYQLFPKQKTSFSFFGFERMFIPYFLLLFCISLILTYFITTKAYSPIKKLTQMVGTDTPETVVSGSASINEFDYLENAYQQLLFNNQLTTGLIEEARPELEQRLFSNILNGIEYSCEELDRQLGALHSAFHSNEKYQIILLQLQDISDADVLFRHIYVKRLLQLALQIFQPGWGELQLLSLNDQNCVLIIQYPSNMSMAQIKRIVRNLENDISRQAEKSSLHISFSAGKVYYSLPDIRPSYQDALDQMHYQLYYHEDSDKTAPETVTAFSREYFSSLIRRLDTSLDKGDMVLTDALFTQLLKELFSCDLDFSSIQELCEQILDCLVGKSISYHADENGLHSQHYPVLYQQLRNASQKEDLNQLIEHDLAEILQNIHTESQKRQHRLISRAKEYISNNYSNCDLSINEIAQDVGCTPSYLSNIFTEYTHENLITYLNTYRINMAEELLTNSQILIKDIGFKTGFNTIQNFNRVFKRITGITPNEYRRKHQTFS